MTSGGGPPGVGDLVHDGVRDREAVVTDMRRGAGRYLLRSPNGPAEWEAEDPRRLTVLCRREERDF